MTRRIVLVGATGAFGERLARRLAAWPDVELVLAARGRAALERLQADIGAAAIAVFDRAAPDGLAALRPWAVVDAAGPFQASDLALARAAIAAGAHYVDIADGRDFVAALPAALDAEAAAAGVLAVTGASSTPALSNAALDTLTAGWRAVDRVIVAISPGARAPRGLSVVQAILSYVGQPVRVFRGARWTTQPGWSGPQRVAFPRLGDRWASLCETPDLDIIPQRAGVRREALFLAGLELAPLHLGLWLLSWPVRLGLVRDLRPLAPWLRRSAGLAERFGSDRGGMVVLADGVGADGEPRAARWWLAADANAGPTTPVAAAAAVLRGLKDGRITARGARACVGLVSLDEIVGELRDLPIRTGQESWGPAEGLFPRVLGEAFHRLPPSVRDAHAAGGGVFAGRGRARGSRRLLPTLVRRALGLPQPGAYPAIEVRITASDAGETWRRRFGRGGFASHLAAGGGLGRFEERFRPLTFRFEPETVSQGFRWRFVGWRLGPLSLPRGLAPEIRARAFEADCGYRFRVLTAHPLAGVLFAYAGRLRRRRDPPDAPAEEHDS
ncbi:DUF4166 domain-containing protein [Phenylobacterium sp.]|jgi:hypothetical protein|uniref:DUF4166 domain-containing protein n=1 Tax=Phenylobacterium sp. TaxID=1871053 RepID=UPI002F91E6FB